MCVTQTQWVNKFYQCMCMYTTWVNGIREVYCRKPHQWRCQQNDGVRNWTKFAPFNWLKYWSVNGSLRNGPSLWNGIQVAWPLNTWSNNTVHTMSNRRHFDVVMSKWRRFDVITTSFLRNVSAGCLESILCTNTKLFEMKFEQTYLM